MVFCYIKKAIKSNSLVCFVIIIRNSALGNKSIKQCEPCCTCKYIRFRRAADVLEV